MNKNEKVKQLAHQAGFDLCGITDPQVIPEAKAAFTKWLKAGRQADMDYLARNPDNRADPAKQLENAQSIIVLGINYYSDNTSHHTPKGFGRVARYARGEDYHKVIETKTKELIDQIREQIPEAAMAEFRSMVDYGPFLEKSYAQKAGLGTIGNQGLLITEQFGTWIFLGEILTTLKLEFDPPADPDYDPCLGCSECVDSCPTGAIFGNRTIDARRCVSYLTIEYRGDIPDDLAEICGNKIFACDICQEVCPHNEVPVATRCEAFRPESGVGEFLDARKVSSLKTEDDHRELTAGTALKRTKIEALRRNAKIVLANQDRRK